MRALGGGAAGVRRGVRLELCCCFGMSLRLLWVWLPLLCRAG